MKKTTTGNSISDRGVSEIAAALEKNKCLETLLLYGEHFFVFNNKRLKLNLAGNNVGDEGLVMLSKALYKNSTLKNINLGGQHFSLPTVI